MNTLKHQLQKLSTPLAITSIASLGLGIVLLYTSLSRVYGLVGDNISVDKADPILRQAQLAVNIGIGLITLAIAAAVLLALTLTAKPNPKLPKA